MFSHIPTLIIKAAFQERINTIMNKEKTLQMISKLSNAKGISGFEDDVVAIINDYSQGYGELKEDTLRNLYLYRKENTGDRPIVQMDSHTDEVGFMVQLIRPNGLLQIVAIGGWVLNNLPGSKVWVRNSEGKYIPGVIASKPPHYMSEEEKRAPLDFKNITVDVGATSKEEAIKNFKIRIGEPIVPAVDFEYDGEHDLMVGKALDNRLGCGMIIDTLEELKGVPLDVDVVASFASQEEVGIRGAVVATRKIKADVAIVFEACPADDTFMSQYEIQAGIKKGPMLRHVDPRMITNPRFQRFALDIADSKGVTVQEGVRSSGGTNAGAIHISNQGIPTIVIGLPVRYAHTHYGIATYFDYENGVKLACEMLKTLNKDIIAGF